MFNLKVLLENFNVSLKRICEVSGSGLKLTPKLLLGSDAVRVRNWLKSRFAIDGTKAIENYTEFADGDLPLEIQKAIIEDAKKGNENAIKYLYYRCYDQIKAAFTSYLGHDSYVRSKKLSGDIDGGLMDWLTVSYNTLCGGYDSTDYDFEKSPIAKFDINRNPTFKAFASFYSNYLRNAISYEHKIQNRHGFAGWGVDSEKPATKNVTSLQSTVAADAVGTDRRLIDILSDERVDVEKNFEATEEEYEFLNSWRAMCKDERFYDNSVGVSPADLVKYALEDALRLNDERAKTGEIKSATKKGTMLDDLNISNYELQKVGRVLGQLKDEYDLFNFDSNVESIGAKILLKYIKD